MQLSADELRALYDERFFTGVAYSDYAGDERVLRKNFRLRLRILRRFTNDARHRRLMEIGSAYGFFLDEARKFFPHVEGIDITDAGTVFARERLGLNVSQADFLAEDYARRRFDVVCLWDTIEHLARPDLYVEKIARLTESGALVALTTGDVESLNARARGARWRLIQPPVHLHYFSADTLRRLLERCGFEVVYNRYCGFYRSAENVAHNTLVTRYRRTSAFESLRRTPLVKFDFYANLYDIMYVIARKR